MGLESPNFQNNNKKERIDEIESYLEEYYKKYKVGYESSGIGNTQNTALAMDFWTDIIDTDRSFFDKIRSILKEKLSDKTLVDLGIGSDCVNIPITRYLPINVPMKKYVGVDIEIPTKESLKNWRVMEKFQEQGTEASFVQEDMLRFVSKLPDESSNFFLAAIDDDVILDEKYWQYLTEEIYRATEKKGIVIDAGVGSIRFFLHAMPDKFKMIYREGSDRGEINSYRPIIFEKI